MLLGEITFFLIFFLFGWWKYVLVLAILQALTLPNIFCSHFLIYFLTSEFSLHITFIFHPTRSLHTPDIPSEVTAHLVRNGALCYKRFFHMFEVASFFTDHSNSPFLKGILAVPWVFIISLISDFFKRNSVLFMFCIYSCYSH